MANKPTKIKLTELTEEDLGFVKEVYDYYIENTTIVYFTEKISIDTLKSFILAGNPTYRSFIIRDEENVPVGFCYFSRYKPREAYDITVEITIYFKPGCTGKGYGHPVMEQLESMIRQSGFTNILSLIDSKNHASISLFEKHGYELCGYIRKVARKFNRPLDLMIYQKILG